MFRTLRRSVCFDISGWVRSYGYFDFSKFVRSCGYLDFFESGAHFNAFKLRAHFSVFRLFCAELYNMYP